jgi:triosephosphate isomerase
MRKKIAAGNWKMNTTIQEGVQLINEIKKKSPALHAHHEVLFFPPSTHLGVVALECTVKNFYAGAQNCSQFEKGAYTGEISTDMIKAVKGTHVIIGHSERRLIFNENNEQLKAKSSAVINAGLTLVYCCGETLEEREIDQQHAIVAGALSQSLFHLPADAMKNVIVAYEPVWAIGTGKTATPAEAQEMHAYIRELLTEQYGEKVASQVPILYGGSVNAANAKELFSQPDIDGGLVGGASLKADEFVAIIAALP